MNEFLNPTNYLMWAAGNLPAGVPIRTVELQVCNQELYGDRDTPDKPLFRHPWQTWAGVDIEYVLSGHRILGSRGKTVWYVPLLDDAIASSVGLKKGQALKIVKIPVRPNRCEEFARLCSELEIQKKLAAIGIAAQAFGIVVLINLVSNRIQWFEHSLEYPVGSVHLATVVEHIVTEQMIDTITCHAPEFRLCGEPINELEFACKALRIAPHDMCLGNVLCSDGRLVIVDVHKWRWLTSSGD